MTEPSALWARRGLTLVGQGEAQQFDPGVGVGRYARAVELLQTSGRPIAFASFTFDPGQAGSVVVIPEETTDVLDATPETPGGALEDLGDGEWQQMVDACLAAIGRGEVSKVVLARRLTAAIDRPVSPFALAAQLIAAQDSSYVYVVDRLVGASPELLLSLHGGKIESIPLAGSAPPKSDSLRSDKTSEEHGIAADSVADAFDRLGVDYSRGEPEVLNTGSIIHLATRFSGEVPDGLRLAEILAALHPTAAVAGTPTEAALNLIRRLEGPNRGRYSGPVGWFDENGNGEFALALRCGLINGSTVELHSGAGIVAASNPGEELEETWWKLEPMLAALGVSVPALKS